MGRCSVIILLVCCLAAARTASFNVRDSSIMDLRMRNAKPDQPDAYLCTNFELDFDEAYIVKFEAMANASTAHHILVYGCEFGPASSENIWGCPPICKNGPQQIMFAWAKNAPPTQLPDDVGLRIGKKTTITSIVLQIHYAKSFAPNEKPDDSGIRLHLKSEKQKYVAGIFLLMSYFFTVPPNNPKYHVDMSCQYNMRHSMFPFAYRTHAHGLGSVISGYQYNDSYHMIGKGNPQWPQAFYPVNESLEVKPGDKLVARCTYNSTGRNRYTNVGATGNDEMCNFYIMYYTDASEERPSVSCGGDKYPNLVNNLPPGNDVTLPPNPLLDEVAHGGHHHHHGGMAGTTNVAHVHNEENEVPPTAADPIPGALQFQSNWPAVSTKLGQVGGVATDKDGNVYIFHRGSRVWNGQSFDLNDNFQFPDQPITEDTILVLTREGQPLRKFGAGKFFMPHGIEVDSKGNIWVTDVALHQVFRFPPNSTEPDLTLGVRFEHQDDATHFCKPTDVAVLESGEFYVTDGYCNSRVLKFSKDGSLLKQWGKENPFTGLPPPNTFQVPHSVTVAEDLGRLYVADRENGRIQVFDLDGKFLDQIQHPDFGSRLFAVEYCPKHGGLVFAVNGPMYGHAVPVQGFTLDAKTGHLLEKWSVPEGLKNPHDVAVDPAGHSVYVGELNPTAVWKFSRPSAEGTKPAETAAPTQAPTNQPATQIADKKNNIPSGDSSSQTSSESEDKSTIAKSLSKELEKGKEDELSDFTPSIIIGVLLVIPVVLLLVITLAMRMHHKGWGSCFSGMHSQKVFSLQKFLGNSHKGFDKLSQDDSDHDNEALSDSDNEEFHQPYKKSKA